MKELRALVFSCAVYSVFSHYLLGISYPGLDIVQSGIRSFVVYSVIFSTLALVPILVGFIASFCQKKNYSSYFDIALGVSWLIALAFLCFSWYAHTRAV